MTSQFRKLFDFWEYGVEYGYKNYSDFRKSKKEQCCDNCGLKDEPQIRRGSEIDKNATHDAAETYYSICIGCGYIYGYHF